MEYHFETILQVRDYECDIQGIVNNANYLHYMEHTRHMFLKECGLSFNEMHEAGEDPVVARMSMQYKQPLRPDDTFRSCLRVSKEGLRYVFHQDLYRECDNRLSLRATVEIVCLVNGRLSESQMCNKAFAKYLHED